MDNALVKSMFDNAVHIGHRTHKWNPKMKKFIYTEKNGIHILNLEKTVDYLEKALQFLGKTVAEGKTILFVSTKPQSIHILEDLAKTFSAPYVVSKWIPGLLTNFATIKQRIKYLADLKDQKQTGEFDKYTKKEASNLNKVIDKLETALGGVQNMKSKPDVVFVVDVVRDNIVVKEARKLGVPVVGIVDTNADPDEVDFPIPANDDALMSLTFLMDQVKSAAKGSRKAA